MPCKRCAGRYCGLLNDIRPCNADYNWKYPTGRQAGRQAVRQSPALHFHGNQDSPPVWMCQGCVFIMHTQSANRAQYHHYITCGIKCIGLGRIYPVLPANEVPARIQCKCLFLIFVFPEMKLRALLFPKQNCNILSLHFRIHVFVSDLHISRIGLPILLQPNRQTGQNFYIFKLNQRVLRKNQKSTSWPSSFKWCSLGSALP